MRRADRLFRMIDLLRANALVTAREIADRFEVSERTVYRDIQHLVLSGVPIEGEAGVGYMLRGFELPPIAFSQEEIDALRLGSRIVESWADPELARAARDAITKIEAAIPSGAQRALGDSALFAPEWHYAEPIRIEVSHLRRALRDQKRVKLEYSNGAGEASTRWVKPLALSFHGAVWMLAAWCELREDFRTFRLDRMSTLEVGEGFELAAHQTLQAYIERMRQAEAEYSDCSEGEPGSRSS